MRKLQSYHHAWLRFHPYRGEDWLRQRLTDGFDVHHIDGDRTNEGPDNLVLIDHGDHMRLHGMGIKLHRIHNSPGKGRVPGIKLTHKRLNRILREYEDRRGKDG